jgi:ribonuclease R
LTTKTTKTKSVKKAAKRSVTASAKGAKTPTKSPSTGNAKASSKGQIAKTPVKKPAAKAPAANVASSKKPASLAPKPAATKKRKANAAKKPAAKKTSARSDRVAEATNQPAAKIVAAAKTVASVKRKASSKAAAATESTDTKKATATKSVPTSASPVKPSTQPEKSAPPTLPPNSLLATVIGHPDGYGFAKLDQGGDDLYLSEDEMRAVLHGDRVAVRASGFARNDKVAGQVVSIIQRGQHRVVGKLKAKDGIWFVVASERRINQDILIAQDKLNKAALDQIVVIEITKQPTPYEDPVGEVVEIVGNEDASDIELEIAIRKHNLPYVFSDAALKEAAAYGDHVKPIDTKDRIDLRETALVTIDGETAKDFDDAVFAQPLASGKGFRLVVAIADVSHYVKLKTALDADARERTTSVYFPRRVIPMLPEALSNELCSLRPNVDRLCVVCDMKVSATGDITSYEFYNAVMNSKARLTYTEVAARLPDLESAKPKAGSIDASLKTLYALYKVFRDARKLRGALDFEGQEAVFTFNDDGSVQAIKPAIRNDAHKLIEEMMLAANVCAGQFLGKAKQPLLYRVHDIPLPEKLAALRETLSLRGLTLGGGDQPEPRDYAIVIEQTRDRIDAPALHMTLLRSLPQAIYTPKNAGHFGLAYEHYAHFTSPIRRYPDLLVHRGIKAVIQKKKYVEPDWDQLGETCSTNERRADIASREVVQFLKAKFLESRLGEEFVGTISGVVPFGVFVTLDDTFADGLVHATTLPRDYYELGRDKVTLVGQRSGFSLSLGERVRVLIAAVNSDSGKVDFEFVGREGDVVEGSPKRDDEEGEFIANAPKRNSKKSRKFERR